MVVVLVEVRRARRWVAPGPGGGGWAGCREGRGVLLLGLGILVGGRPEAGQSAECRASSRRRRLGQLTGPASVLARWVGAGRLSWFAGLPLGSGRGERQVSADGVDERGHVGGLVQALGLASRRHLYPRADEVR